MTPSPPTLDCDELARDIPDLVAAYVFGSTADGTDLPGSDLDLALLASAPLGNRRRWELQQLLARRLRAEVDLVDLRRAPTVLQIRIVAGGRRICCRDDDEAARFEDFVFASYARLNEERREILAQVAAEGRTLAR